MKPISDQQPEKMSQFYVEKERLKDLLEYEILDTPVDEAMNSLARLASQICETPIAQINFIDDKRQWSKAMVGVDFQEIPRETGFCIHTIRNEKEMILSDVSRDERFKDMPFVQNDPKIRFYAGINVKSNRGYNIGTICVIGSQVKELTDYQHESLKILAKEVEARLELHRNNRFLKKKNEDLKKTATFLFNSADIMFLVDSSTEKITEINSEVNQLLGFKKEEIQGKRLAGFLTDPNFLKEFTQWKEEPSKQKFTSTCSLKTKSGDSIWLLVHITENNGVWYGTARDITKRKTAEIELRKSLHEKELMLAEIHHRVKNNLAVISGLLQLEYLSADNAEVCEILKINQSRIQTMALIHENLYQNEFFTHVPLKKVINKMIQDFRGKNQISDKIRFDIQITEIFLNINQAIPASLLLNELLFESLYNSISKIKSIEIDFSCSEDQIVSLVLQKVFDNSAPCDSYEKEKSDLNRFSLVEVLTQQLGGHFEKQEEENKLSYQISFNKADIKGSSASGNF